MTADHATEGRSLTVIRHPLVDHKITLLRDVETSSSEFRALCQEITLLTAYEALRGLPTETRPVTTPITVTDGHQLAGNTPVIVGILRAGLIMVDAMLTLLPTARVGHVGLFRDPDTHRPVEYYNKLPTDIAARTVILVDPMLATGGSAIATIDHLKEAGVTDLLMISIIGCPEGVDAVHDAHPDVAITVAALDERLDENAYIVPGLGDAGDRIYGTK